ncbi:50S ribosomal protein L24 [Haliangium sp. UPWRP_2]|uniref:50S ribosomal protein L24 n=1 Tax=Haliangium sp. UPWRP_2 TaxID=1931276 RepID=UPI000B53FB57|nr:50S ribosomal protein L24 [Haliangium sp. UPWRP_2]PSM32436.1 50S ribosomal protein L24 [Haliangium sp. UPWRP_2]
MQRIRKGDLVEVIAGKEKGKRARVLRVLQKTQRVVLERLTMVKRHTKPTQNNQGGILEKEGTIHLSNVMPVDPGTDKATRVKTIVKDGVRLRAGKSGTVIEAEKK